MSKKNLHKKRVKWVTWIVILVLSAFVLPYIFLSNIYQIEGAFLFWTGFAVVAIVSTIKITTYWSDKE